MFNTELQAIGQELSERRGVIDSIKEEIASNTLKKEKLEDRKAAIIRVNKLVEMIAKEIQSNLEFHLANIASIGLRSVMKDNAPMFHVEFTQKRNKTECEMYFEEEGDKLVGDDSSGTSLDIASFTLLPTFWSLPPPEKRTRPLFILDEPFRFVSPDLQGEVSKMINMLSEELKIQIIMVSHEEDINIEADRTFEVTKKNKRSIVEVIR